LPDTTIKELLEAGAHFGHQTSRWDPRMKKYIFTKRNGIHIIDLERTSVMLSKAKDFVRQHPSLAQELENKLHTSSTPQSLLKEEPQTDQ